MVGDKVLQRMKPYYSELAVDLKGETPQGLEQKLDALADPDDRDFPDILYHPYPEIAAAVPIRYWFILLPIWYGII